jgi:hypothetical protein
VVRLFLPLLLVIGIGLVAAIALSYRHRQPIRPGSPAEFKNHQDMARWIERALHDDLIRVTIPPTEQDRARRLLGEFFGEPPNELP